MLTDKEYQIYHGAQLKTFMYTILRYIDDDSTIDVEMRVKEVLPLTNAEHNVARFVHDYGVHRWLMYAIGGVEEESEESDSE